MTSIETIDDSLARALCWGAAWDMTRDAEMSASDFVTLVLSGIALRDRRVRRQPDSRVRRDGRHALLGARPTAARCGPAGSPACGELLMTAEPGGDHQLSFARAYAGAAHSDQALADLEGLLDGSLGHRRPRRRHRPALDAALRRWPRTAAPTRARIDEELARDNTISGKEHAAAARALRPTAEAKAEAWELAMVRDDVPNETQRSIVLAFQAYGQDEVLAPYVEKYLAAADTMWEEKGTQRASTALEYIFPKQLASQALLDRRRRRGSRSSPANPAAKRYVREGRDDVARALRAQAKDAG